MIRKVATAIIFISCCCAAEDPAGWTAAKWGMSPAQVRAAIPEVHDLTGPAPERTFISGDQRYLAEIGIGRFPLDGIDWKVYFTFEGPKGLTGVWITPADKTAATLQRFRSLENLLVQRYGSPFERHANDGPVVTTAQWSFPKTTIELSHTVILRTLESLYLTYRSKSPEVDKL